MFIRMMVLVKTGLDDLPCRFVYSGRSKKEDSWEDGADFLPFEQLLKVTFKDNPLIFSYCIQFSRCQTLSSSPVPSLLSCSICSTAKPLIG